VELGDSGDGLFRRVGWTIFQPLAMRAEHGIYRVNNS